MLSSIIILVAIFSEIYPNLDSRLGCDTSASIDMVLGSQGYVDFPVTQGSGTGWYYITVKLNGKPAKFMIDTGASHNLIDIAAAQQPEKLPENNGKIDFLAGLTLKTYQNMNFQLRIGTLNYDHNTFSTVDLSVLSAAGYDSPTLRNDGILGSPFLKYYSAVIDYQHDKIYLLDPALRTKPLQGRWICINEQWKARNHTTLNEQLLLAIEGAKATFSRKNLSTIYAMQLRPGTPNRVDFLLGRWGVKPCIYKLDNDTLTIAGQLTDATRPFAERPTSFTTTPNSRYIVLTFKRVRKTDDHIPHIKD